MSNKEKSTRELISDYGGGLMALFGNFPFGTIPHLGVSAVEYHDSGVFQSVVFDPAPEPLYWSNYLQELKKICVTFQDISGLAFWLLLPSGEVVNTGFFPFHRFFSVDGLYSPIRERITFLHDAENLG